MSKVTCDVIKDLIPLYVDDVLSEDSKKIVDEHLEGCAGCSDYYKRLKEPDDFTEREDKESEPVKDITDDDKKVIQGIRKNIRSKKVRTAIITALCIIASVIGLFYFVVVREIYIPFQRSGIYFNKDEMRTEEMFYRSYGVYTPNGKECYVYLTSTLYTNLTQYYSEAKIKEVSDQGISKELPYLDYNNEEGFSCKKIYYVNKEAAKKLGRGDYMNMTESDIEELKNSSMLIWENIE